MLRTVGAKNGMSEEIDAPAEEPEEPWALVPPAVDAKVGMNVDANEPRAGLEMGIRVDAEAHLLVARTDADSDSDAVQVRCCLVDTVSHKEYR